MCPRREVGRVRCGLCKRGDLAVRLLQEACEQRLGGAIGKRIEKLVQQAII